MLIYIWAQDEQGLVGKDNTLPWRLPNDLKFFKEVTMGQTMLMGRKTFEGMGSRLLPGRQTILLTRSNDYEVPGAEVVTDIDAIIEDSKHEDIYVCGGAEVYRLLKDHVELLYCTRIHHTFEGDTYFPTDFPWGDFIKVKSLEGEMDEKNLYPHTFEIYERKEGSYDHHGMMSLEGRRKKSISMQYVHLNRASEIIIKCFQLQRMSLRPWN